MSSRIRVAYALVAALTACTGDVADGPLYFDDFEVDSRLDFGDVPVGTSARLEVLIANNGGLPATIERVTIDGDPAFELAGLGLERLPPNDTARIGVVFEPVSRDATSAVVSIELVGESSHLFEVTVDGRGVVEAFDVRPDSIDFGRVAIHESETAIVEVSNRGDATDVVFALESEVRECRADRAANFCVDTPGEQPAVALPANATIELEVVFRARSVGDAFATLALATPDGAPMRVGLRGLGVENRILCDPTTVEFDAVNLGTCGTRRVRCDNVGQGPVTIASASFGEGAPGFEIASAPTPRVLRPDDSILIDVAFCPDSVGRRVTTLVIETDQREVERREIEIEVIGWGGGGDVRVAPSRVDFGLVSTLAPATRHVLVTNAGTSLLRIPTSTVSGPFTIPLWGAWLAPGESSTLAITFAPSTAGIAEGVVRFETNDPDTPLVEIPIVGEGVDVAPCQYAVTASVAFGDVEVQRALRRELAITNLGSSRCLLSSVEVTPLGAFANEAVRTQWIEPGATELVGVTFGPDATGPAGGTLMGSISSDAAPNFLVDLAGRGVERAPLLAPDEVVFGAVDSTCGPVVKTVRLYNAAAVDMTVSSAALESADPGFTMSSAGASVVGPDEFLEFEVTFTPGASGGHTNVLWIRGEVAGSPFEVAAALSARVSPGAIQVDRLPPMGAADVLFVLDNTSSLADEHMGIAESASMMIDIARSMGLDYRIGVTTGDSDTDLGRLVHPGVPGDLYGGPAERAIITSRSNPSPAEVLASNIVGVGTGAPGSPVDESFFESTYLAFTAPNALGANAGFLRRDAVLGIIILSDETEQSPRSVDFYADYLNALEQDPNQLTVSSMTGDLPSGCNGASGPAVAGPRFAQLVTRTGGAFRSVCDPDFTTTAMTLMRRALGLRDSIALKTTPIPATIEVRIDGVVVPATSPSGTINWTLDFANRRVRFTPFAVPEPGAEVAVRYAVACP